MVPNARRWRLRGRIRSASTQTIFSGGNVTINSFLTESQSHKPNRNCDLQGGQNDGGKADVHVNSRYTPLFTIAQLLRYAYDCPMKRSLATLGASEMPLLR